MPSVRRRRRPRPRSSATGVRKWRSTEWNFAARRRLLDGADDAHTVGLRHRGRGGQQNAVERADEDHRHRKLALTDAPDELHAVHLRHLEIGHDDVDRLAGAIQKGERLVSRRRLDDARPAHAGQRPGEQVALVAVVVDHEKAQAVEIDRLRVGNQFHHAAAPGPGGPAGVVVAHGRGAPPDAGGRRVGVGHRWVRARVILCFEEAEIIRRRCSRQITQPGRCGRGRHGQGDHLPR